MYKPKGLLTDLIIVVLFVISGIWSVCLAQKDPKLDSLLMVLQIVKDDTSKVNTLNELCKQLYKTSKYTEAKKYAEDALSLAGKINFKKGTANSYHIIGNICGFQGNYPEAMKNYLTSLIIREEMGDKKGIASSYNSIANLYHKQAEYSQALKNHLSALKIREEMGVKKDIADSYHVIGIIFYEQGNYSQALKSYLTSIKISKEIGDKKGIANSYGNIGAIFYNQGNYTEALNNYLTSLKIIEVTGDKKGIAGSYNNIGVIYKDQGNYTEALKYFLASLNIKQEIGDKKGIAYSYINIGLIYAKLSNYSEALDNYFASLKIMEEIKDKKGIANSYMSIGNIYNEQSNYPEALKNYFSSLKINEELGDKVGIAINYINLGWLNIKLNKLDEAKKYLDNGLALSKKFGIKNVIKDSYQGLTELDSIVGDYKQALAHYKLYTSYKDSLLNETNSKSIAEIKTKYETEKKDKEIQTLESEKRISNLQLMVQHESLNRIQSEKAKIHTENLYNIQQVELLGNEQKLQQLEIVKNQADLVAQKAETDRKHDQVMLLNKEGEIQKLEIKKQTLLRNYLIAGLALFSILGFFIYNNYRTRQKLKLQTLRNKIASDLHDDVGSTLSSISIFSQIAQEQSKEVIPLLETIGESSRKMLDAMADIIWTINPENDQFEKIILRMRSFAYELLGAKNIDFEFIADDDISKIKLPMEVRKNLYLIFKEATNNMVKYSNADKAKFEIRNESDQLNMMIRDNGKGFDMNSSTQGNGIKNMMRRAEEIGAKFMIDSFPGNGTTIQLRIAV